MNQIDTAKAIKPEMIRISKAIDLLGISRSKFYREKDAGNFTIVKRGSLSYVPTKEVEDFLNPNNE